MTSCPVPGKFPPTWGSGARRILILQQQACFNEGVRGTPRSVPAAAAAARRLVAGRMSMDYDSSK